MKYAVINDATNKVENIIVADSKHDVGKGKSKVEATLESQIGGSYDGVDWTPKPEPATDTPRFEDAASAVEVDTSLDTATKTALATVLRSL